MKSFYVRIGLLATVVLGGIACGVRGAVANSGPMSVVALLAAAASLLLLCTGVVVLLLERARRGVGSDPYPPEAAEAPVAVRRGESLTVDEDGYLRATPWVDGDHPQDCADTCCYGLRLDELVAAYDWNAAERDIVRPWRGQAR